MNNLQDKCRGSLVGGAVGDALGYAVEFDTLSEIRRKYGIEGISNYELENGVAVFSDDTQMSLFTAGGLLNGRADGAVWDTELLPYIKDSHIRWYYTQTKNPLAFSSDRLTHINNLWKRRAPGNTCMPALKTLDLAVSDVLDTEGIRKIGEGWVGDEALSIAVFCVMRYIDDFLKCIVCAVNHDGDSDSSGAIAGNIIGAILGYMSLMKLNDYCREKFIDYSEIDFDSIPNLILTRVLHHETHCKCRNYIPG